MYLFWEWVALLILVALLWKPVGKLARDALDGHAQKVRHELAEAKRLREEAQSLLAEHQRRLTQGEAQAKSIVDHARAEVHRLTERHRVELEASLNRRAEQAQERIAQEEARAVHQLRAHAAALAVRTTERLLRDQMGGAQATALLDRAIADVGRKLA